MTHVIFGVEARFSPPRDNAGYATRKKKKKRSCGDKFSPPVFH